MKKKKKSLLWQIEHPALAGPSFLFGTMHVRDEQAFGFLEKISGRLEQCAALATEYNLSTDSQPNLASSMLLPEGTYLNDLFSPKQYHKLRRILLKAFGVDLRFFSRFVPLLIINIVSEQLLQQDRPRALDLELWHMAGNQGKLRLGIETLEEQLAVLRQIPLDHQVQLLRSLARNVSRFRHATLRSTSLYQSADPQRLYQVVRRSSQGMRSLLLFERNRIMAERIHHIIRDQPTFCAVGAGHLAGKTGVIRLLKQQGYGLAPVRLDDRS